ncbi:MAG: hypothetical protein ACR2NN_08930 [Bryobacteraceae bacterium]
MLQLVPILASLSLAATFPKSEVKIIGPIDYGQTSPAVHYRNPPKYRAFGFNARPGDHVEIWVHARQGSPEAFLTDSAFTSIAGGNARFSATIPQDSKPATYYIVFRDMKSNSGNFTVELQRPYAAR